MRASDRDCQAGKRTVDLKLAQADGEIGCLRGAGVVERVDVDEGLKGIRDGVTRALRFCIMLSSVVARERRRKSM